MNRKHLLCLLMVTVLLCCGAFGQRAESSAEAPAPSAAAETSVPEAPGRRTIRIFETSDIHGYLLDTTGGEEAEFQYRLAYIAHIVNEARGDGQYDDVLLVDGGDIYQGMPVSNMSKGAAVIAALDAMDYDAVALGNHEFDWGVSDLVTGGHTHEGIYGVAESGVPYIQSDCYAKGYASATIVIDGDGNVRIEEPLSLPASGSAGQRGLYRRGYESARHIHPGRSTGPTGVSAEAM